MGFGHGAATRHRDCGRLRAQEGGATARVEPNHQRVRVVGAMSRDRGWAHEDFATKIADECELAVWTHGRVT